MRLGDDSPDFRTAALTVYQRDGWQNARLRCESDLLLKVAVRDKARSVYSGRVIPVSTRPGATTLTRISGARSPAIWRENARIAPFAG